MSSAEKKIVQVALIRHGKTEANMAGRYTGRMDISVSEMGIGELESLLAANIYEDYDTIFVSPLKRCRETAAMIFKDREHIVVDGVIEMNFGDFENMTFEEIIAIPEYSDWGTGKIDNSFFPNGEEINEFKTRCKNAFLEIVDRAVEMDKETCAIVCHGGVIMSIMEAFVSSDEEEQKTFYDWLAGNGCGYLIDFDVFNKTAKFVRGICL